MLNGNPVNIFSGKLSKDVIFRKKIRIGSSHFSSPKVKKEDGTTIRKLENIKK